MGHAFYPNSISFKNSLNGTAYSFSTTFIFAIVSEYPRASQHGLAFVIAPTRGLPEANPRNYLGLLNPTNNGNKSNHVFAVELDTFQSDEFGDPDDNHVGIDINSLNSTQVHTAGFYGADNSDFTTINLTSSRPIQVWVNYNATTKMIDVTVAPIGVNKPRIPLLSLEYDLTPILDEFMYVGFSASSGRWTTTFHYLLAWSFEINGQAEEIDLSRLPKLPGARSTSMFLTIGLPVICVVLVVAAVVVVALSLRRRRKFQQLKM